MLASRRALLYTSISAPSLYFAALLLGSLLHPGYNHATQLVSELGMAGAGGAAIFNAGIFLSGMAGFAAGFAFYARLRQLGRPVLGALTGVCIALWGISFVVGGLFPLPNPLHMAFGLGLAAHLAPIFLLAALRGLPGYRPLKIVLITAIVLMTLSMAAIMDVGGLVNDANVGVYQRLYALAAFPWVAAAGIALQRGRSAEVVPEPQYSSQAG